MNAHDNWDLLITHANLATMRGGYGIIENAALAVKDGRIAWLGMMAELPHQNATKTINAAKKWLTPGLIDCHTHLVYAGDRTAEFAMKLEGKSYTEIAAAGGGILSTMRATRAASEEELFAQSAKRLEYFLREGVTTMEIKSGYGLDVENEIKMLRVARRLSEQYPVTIRTTFLGAHALPPEFADKDSYVDFICTEMLPRIAAENLADAVDGFCESIGFSPTQMARVFDAAKAHGLPVKLHAEQLTDQNGAALAAKYQALSADHLEYLSEAGAEAMGRAGTVAVLLPGAFFMLREKQKPPVEALRKYGVKIAVASDSNPGTSPTTSLLQMLPMACVMFGLTPEEALLGVTANAAAALGLADRGTLAIGQHADLALWDIHHPLELSCRLGWNGCDAHRINGFTL